MACARSFFLPVSCGFQKTVLLVCIKHPLGKDAIPDPVIISNSTAPISPATPLHSFSLPRRSFPMSEQFPPNFVSLNSVMPENRIMQYFMTLSMMIKKISPKVLIY